MAVIKTLGKLAPGAYKQMIDHLTRKKIKNPFIKAKDIVVDKKPEVENREAINAFIRRQRQDMAGGGMLVQPGFGGTRQGYRSEKIQAVKRGGDKELLLRLVKKANEGFKYVKRKDLQVQAGYKRSTNITAKQIGLDTLETKFKKAFDFVMGNPDKLVTDMFDPMTQVKKLVGTNEAVGKYLKDYAPYEESRRLIKVLAAPRSKSFLQKAKGLTLGDLEFRIDNNIKGDDLFAPPKQVTAETKIMEIVDRHIKQGGKKIKWTVKPEITKGGYPSFGESRFIYNGKEYGMGELINEARDDPNFKEFFKAQRDYKTLNDKIVTHPKTGEKIRFGNLMKEVYGDSVVPYNIDHVKSIIEEPFTSLRILPARINKAAGNIIQMDEKFITNPELKGKYTKQGKEAQLKKIGYNFNQPVEDLIQAELKLADDVLNKGRVLRKPNEIVESVRKGENYVPDFYSKTAKPGSGFEKQLEVREQFLKNLENKKFGRVADVVIKTANDNGFGDLIQKKCVLQKKAKGGRIFLKDGPGCPAAREDPKGFLKSVSDNPEFAKFLKSGPGQRAASLAARVTGNVLNPSTLIGGEVAFVLGDGLNNFASGLPLDESFDRAFIFADFGKFEKNLMNQARELGYDDNQLNLLQQTININKLDNRRRKLEYGLEVGKQDPSALTSDATMGFENRLVNTNKNLDNTVINYLGTLDKMGFDSSKAADQDTGFRYLDNVFKKRTQDQLIKDFEDRKRQVDPTQTPFGDFISPVFDLGSYTQPLKFAADIFNPFTKDVPFLSERQQLAKKLREASEEELDEINRKRGFTIENIQQGTAPQIRPLMDYLGTDVTGQGFGTQFLAGGGIAKLAGVDSGPPPESGPNSQGLPGLLKRVKKL